MSSKRVIHVLALAAFLSAGLAARAESAIITIVPSSQTVASGANVSIDIVLSGLTGTEAVGSFDFDLLFNTAVLSGTSATVDPGNAFQESPGGYEIFSFAGGNGSPLTVNAAADFGCDFACLKALQGSGFTLATVNFLATAGSGITNLTFQNVAIFADDGITPIATQAGSGSVCVGAVCNVVPEPASFGLLALGLAAAFARRSLRRAE
jgi:hypothetical protein